jgi:prepilin peptidase CpaA
MVWDEHKPLTCIEKFASYTQMTLLVREITVERYFLIIGLIFAIWGGTTDVCSRRIPNWLTYSGLVTAMIFRSLFLGWAGVRSGFLGAVVAGAFFYIFFLLGGMGGGDVKLIAAVGAWAGQRHILVILITAAIAGGVLALAYMAVRQHTTRALRNIMKLMRHHFTLGLSAHPEINVNEQRSIRVPFGLAIAIGTLYGAGSALWWR